MFAMAVVTVNRNVNFWSTVTMYKIAYNADITKNYIVDYTVDTTANNVHINDANSKADDEPNDEANNQSDSEAVSVTKFNFDFNIFYLKKFGASKFLLFLYLCNRVTDVTILPISKCTQQSSLASIEASISTRLNNKGAFDDDFDSLRVHKHTIDNTSPKQGFFEVPAKRTNKDVKPSYISH
jgi:hypothetical protein